MTQFRLAPASLVCLVLLFTAVAFGEPARGGVMRTFYVSPQGDDSNPGTQQEPWATIVRARDAVRQINRNQIGDIVVILGGGTYAISAPIVFDPRDSGPRPQDRLSRRRRAAAGPQRRPRHHRLAARYRRTLEGDHRPEQLPPVVRGWKTGRAGTWRCVAARRTPRQRRLHDHGRGDGRLEEPGRHRALLLRGLVPHAVQGQGYPAQRRPRRGHHAPAPLHQCAGKGGRSGESAQLHRERLGVARRTR